MRFIHCADLHLDSKMESALPKEKARERREELLMTWERLVEYAAANRVRAVLISGDIFDKPHNRKDARNRVREIMERHPEIDFYCLRGNHDNSDFLMDVRTEDVSDTILRFRNDEWVMYSYDDDTQRIVIAGREINKDKSYDMSRDLVLDQADFNIVMLHGSISGTDDENRININEFKGKNIDYMALGHYHSLMTGRIDDRGVYAYSGCLEGRGFDEAGEKGFILLDIQNNKIKTQFVPFAFRTIHEVHIDITECESMMDVIDLVHEKLRGIPERDIVNVVLDGHIQMDLDLDTERIKKNIIGDFYYARVTDNTRVQVDYESFRDDRSLKGEFVRLLESTDMNEDTRSEIIETGMKAVMGEDIDE